MKEIRECLPHRTMPAIYHQVYRNGWSIAGNTPEPNWEAVEKYLEIRKG
jgi:hypothetical protein